MKERRLKLVYVPQRFVLNYLNRPQGEFLSLPQPIELPADVQVLTVHYAFERDAFAFIVGHASFDVVSDACVPPEVRVEWETIELQRHDPTVTGTDVRSA